MALPGDKPRLAISQFLGLIVLIAGLTAAQPQVHETQGPSEYQVKAAFLLNFTKFIDWPAGQPAEENLPFSICILGENPFGRALEEIVEGETVNGRKIAVQHVEQQRTSSCQVLFVSRSVKDAAQLLAGSTPGVLTVGEEERFIRDGGIIGFVIENHRVRFDINQRAALRSGLTISSKLLKVARSVEK